MLARLIAALWLVLGIVLMGQFFGFLYAIPGFVIATGLALRPSSRLVLAASMVLGGLLTLTFAALLAATAADERFAALGAGLTGLAGVVAGMSAVALHRHHSN